MTYETLREVYAATCKERDRLQDQLKQLTPDWIPVTERLPENGHNVLIYSKETGVAEGYLNPAGHWIMFRWSCRVSTVTHWWPMPAKPKEDV